MDWSREHELSLNTRQVEYWCFENTFKTESRFELCLLHFLLKINEKQTLKTLNHELKQDLNDVIPYNLSCY